MSAAAIVRACAALAITAALVITADRPTGPAAVGPAEPVPTAVPAGLPEPVPGDPIAPRLGDAAADFESRWKYAGEPLCIENRKPVTGVSRAVSELRAHYDAGRIPVEFVERTGFAGCIGYNETIVVEVVDRPDKASGGWTYAYTNSTTWEDGQSTGTQIRHAVVELNYAVIGPQVGHEHRKRTALHEIVAHALFKVTHPAFDGYGHNTTECGDGSYESGSIMSNRHTCIHRRDGISAYDVYWIDRIYRGVWGV